MPLLRKKELFKSKLLKVHRGVSDVSKNHVVQLVLISPTTKEAKAINVGEGRVEEVIALLESATEALKDEFHGTWQRAPLQAW